MGVHGEVAPVSRDTASDRLPSTKTLRATLGSLSQSQLVLLWGERRTDRRVVPLPSGKVSRGDELLHVARSVDGPETIKH